MPAIFLPIERKEGQAMSYEELKELSIEVAESAEESGAVHR